MKNLPAMALLHSVALRGFLRRKDPDPADLALRIELVFNQDAFGDHARHHDHVAAIADLRARGERHALAIELDRHAFDVAHRRALSIGGEATQQPTRPALGREKTNKDGGYLHSSSCEL